MLTINSKDRDSGTSGNLIMKKVSLSKIKRFKIDYIHLPFSWYNVTSSNNAIRINGTNTVTISVGQYDSSSLASALQTALIVVDASFTVTYSTITGKFTIARSTNFNLNLSSSLFTMKRILGFNATSDTTAATSVTSDSFANLLYSNSLSLHSNVFGKVLMNQISDYRSEYVLSVPVDANPGDVISFKPGQDVIYQLKDEVTTGEFSLYWKDIDGNIVDLNGCDWEIKLIF